MVSEGNATPSDCIIATLIPAWLAGLAVSVSLFMLNPVHFLWRHVYFFVVLLIVFYFCGAITIRFGILALLKISSKLSPVAGAKLKLGYAFLAKGIVVGAFAALYLLDVLRQSFFVSRELPQTPIAFLFAVVMVLFVFIIISAVSHWIFASLEKVSRSVLVLIMIGLTLFLPYLFRTFWVEQSYGEQHRSISSRKQVLPEVAAEQVQGNEEHLIVFGIDGATWRLLVPLMNMGHCPTLKYVREQGVSAQLKTIVPTLSPVIWTSMATGMLPAKHGIQHFARFRLPLIGTIPAKLRWPEHTLLKQFFRFVEKRGLLYSELYTSQMRTSPTFYEILSNWGEATGIVNWWCSWPVRPQEGFIISERFSYSIGEAILRDERTRPFETYPSHLAELYRSEVRNPHDLRTADIARFMKVEQDELDHIIEQEQKPWFFSNWFWFRTVHQSDRSMHAIGTRLYEEYQPRLYCLYHQSIDVVEHHYWHYLEPESFPGLSPREVDQFRLVIPAAYDYEDQVLASLMESGDPKNIIIVSDHGMEPTGRLPKSGDHVKGLPAGIFLGCGPAFEMSMSCDDISVVDIAPLILTVMGYPLAADMDGIVPDNVLRESFLAKYPARAIPTYGDLQTRELRKLNSATDQELFKKLKGLGYLN